METAMFLIAAFRGIFHGIQTWLKYKDRARTREAQESVYEETLRSESTRSIAKKLISIVPQETIDMIRKRVDRCYKKFNSMLKNEDEFFEGDITNAAKNALPACVCRNLGMMVDVVGDLPDQELRDAWDKYECKEKQENSFMYM